MNTHKTGCDLGCIGVCVCGGLGSDGRFLAFVFGGNAVVLFGLVAWMEWIK